MWRNRLVTLKNIFKWRNVRWWQVKILTSYPSKCQIKKEDMTVILLRIFFKGAGYSLGWWESYRRYFRNNSTVNDPSTWRLDGSFVSGLWEILRNCYGVQGSTDYNWRNRETDAANTGLDTGHFPMEQRGSMFGKIWGTFLPFAKGNYV